MKEHNEVTIKYGKYGNQTEDQKEHKVVTLQNNLCTQLAVFTVQQQQHRNMQHCEQILLFKSRQNAK